MYVGVDYYPEHWPKSRWETDAKLMKEAGFNVVRLAEFAWGQMEPEEGRYEFGWLDEALAILKKNGISAILGTPTAAMPAWAAAKYPETLMMRNDGSRVTWGVRKNNCMSSGAFRLLSERITAAMAEHFAKTPNVIGWQTDNEFGGHSYGWCHCQTCRREFQDWLRAKYGTTDELNRAWGTHFWGALFGEWSEVVIPENETDYNPSTLLDWNRFTSWQNVRFQRDQVMILREACPGHFITHNFMGLFKDIDYYHLAEDLDFVSWDNYPIWGSGPAVRYGSGLAADVMRGLKGKNFWIMEQTAGPGGWGAFSRNVRPGELRNISYQQLAHGADAQVWFRWRTCTAGREQYWHGLLGHDGRPLRRYREAARTAREYHKLAKHIEGTTPEADVAIVYDYDSIWATLIQPGFKENDTREDAARYYNALMRAGVGCDVIPRDGDFSSYKLVIATEIFVMPDEVADNLVEYVKNGGVLLTDYRTNVKDETNLCYDRTLPGRLSPALGIEIEEYESIPADSHYAVKGTGKLAGDFTAVRYADWITPKKAATIASYGTGHMKPFAAVTRNAHGKGLGWYVGAVMKEDAFYDKLMAAVLSDARVKPAVTPPPGVEAMVRSGKSGRFLFLVNHMEEPRTAAVPAGKTELITGKRTARTLDLEPFGVAVIKL